MFIPGSISFLDSGQYWKIYPIFTEFYAGVYKTDYFLTPSYQNFLYLDLNSGLFLGIKMIISDWKVLGMVRFQTYFNVKN